MNLSNLDYCYNSFKNTYIIEALILSLPLYWGIYEFRQFKLQLKDFQKSLDEIKSDITDICDNKLDKYPFINDLKKLIDKINKIFVL